MYTTNAGELLLGSPFRGCGLKLSGWTWSSAPIAPGQALFNKHGSLQVSGLRAFRLKHEIINEFRNTSGFCLGNQTCWIVFRTWRILGCCI